MQGIGRPRVCDHPVFPLIILSNDRLTPGVAVGQLVVDHEEAGQADPVRSKLQAGTEVELGQHLRIWQSVNRSFLRLWLEGL